MTEMRFFKITFEENGLHERYLMLEKEPEKNSKLQSLLCVISTRPDMEYGGIYGGEICPYGMFLPSDARIEETSIDEFALKIMESLRKNYVRKSELKSYLENLL